MPELHQCTCPRCQSKAEAPEKAIHHQINLLMSRLNEQQRRWYAALEARRYGHGGIKLVSQITGLDEKTIRRGRDELDADLADRPDDRVRLPGAGRPATKKKVETALLDRVAPEGAGDPQTGRRWTSRSRLKRSLQAAGHRLSGETIRRLLYKHKIRPKSNVKRLVPNSPTDSV